MAVQVKVVADGWQVRHEQIVNQIDVERATPDVLQAGTDNRPLGEVLLVIAEVHEDDGQQRKACQGQRQGGPGHSQPVPLLGVEPLLVIHRASQISLSSS